MTTSIFNYSTENQ